MTNSAHLRGGASRDDAAARGADDIGPLRVMRLSAAAKYFSLSVSLPLRFLFAVTVLFIRGAHDTKCINYELLLSHGRLPERGSAGAVGYDLFASEDALVPAR